jgi:hypothetical protein
MLKCFRPFPDCPVLSLAPRAGHRGRDPSDLSTSLERSLNPSINLSISHIIHHLEGHITMTMLAAACRHTLRSSAARAGSRQQPQAKKASLVVRRFESTKPEIKPEIKPEEVYANVDTTKPPIMLNLALATVLAGFVGGVFTYSMNAVGKSQEGIDPLAQLKEEAQDAREHNQHNRKLTPEEVQALETGRTEEYDQATKLQVAVAAPADIVQLEEEANLKVFGQKQGDVQEKKKKPWWRFGF